MKTKIQTSKAPKAIGPYSQAIVEGNLIFTSGQIYLTPEGKLLEGIIEEQTRQVMENLKEILYTAGSDFSKVVKTTVYLTDISLFERMNEIYKSYIKEPYPARETIVVKDLPKGAKLEISMIAVRGE